MTAPRRPAALLASLGLFALAGCGASPPLSYHTLVPTTDATGATSQRQAARAAVEVLPVAIPERVNRDEVVLVGPGQGLDIRDNDRWAAPLADDMRQLIDDALWRRAGAADTYAAPVSTTALAHFRLATRVERLDASPGRVSVVEGSWSLRRLPDGAPVLCRARFSQPWPGTDVAGAVHGLARGAAHLADAIADSLDRLSRGDADPCGQVDSAS